MKTNIENALIGKFYGMINGSRVYRVRRGHFQIQNPTRPNQSCFDGTLREINRAEKSTVQKFKFAG